MRSLPLLTLLSAIAIACGGEETPPPPVDTLSYELFPTTRMVEGAELASLRVAGDDGVMVFDPAPAALSDIALGMVLVGGATPAAPHGFVRGVGDVVREGTKLTLTTMQVPVQLAFRRLDVRVARTIDDLADPGITETSGVSRRGLRTAAPMDGRRSRNLRWVLFDGDGDEGTLDDQVRLEGELGGGFAFDARFEINWGAVESLPDAVAQCLRSIPGILIGRLPDCTPLALLPEAKATFEVGPDLFAHADLIGSASLSFQEEIGIVHLTLSPIPVGPIVLVPAIDVLATLTGSAGAKFRTGFDANLSARINLVASTKTGVGLEDPRLDRSEVVARPTELSIMAKGRVALGARLSVTLYGIIGPYGQVDGFAELLADTSRDPCWEIAAGLSARAGLTLTTPRLPVLGYVTLFDFHTPTLDLVRTGALASGRCTMERGSQLPGAGPDEVEYGNPSFPTWSSFATVAGDAPWVASPGLAADIAFTQLEPMIDGRYLVSSHDVRRISKITEAGTTTWQRGYTLDGAALSLGHFVAAPDATVYVLARDNARNTVLRLDQAGGVLGAVEYTIAQPGCEVPVAASVIAARASGGVAVAGHCRGSDAMYLLELGAALTIERARLLRTPEATRLIPQASGTFDGVAWIVGSESNAGGFDRMFAMKLDGEIPSATTYAACPAYANLSPSRIRPARLRGELLITGTSASQHEGLIVRIRPDGSVAFSSFPSIGEGASEISGLQDVTELPTTGYLVAGTTAELIAADPALRVSAPFIAWIDSGGRVFRALRLEVDEGTRPAGFPSVRLTDDGGLLMAQIIANDLTSRELWTFKAFAKDGRFTHPRVRTRELRFELNDCALTTATATVSATALSPSVARVQVDVSSS